MTALVFAVGSAFWLGILTSISPCPLASNVAAVSFIGRSVATPWRAVLSGLVYSLGRAVTYVAVGALVITSALSVPGVSLFLQERMNQVLGPLLIVIGIGMLGWLRLPFGNWSWPQAVSARTARAGLWGAGILGMAFALSFCPVSAGLFFGALIPLAINAHSSILLPAVYGIGTGLPVAFFAIFLVLGTHWVARTFGFLTAVERGARPVTGIVFVAAGVYLTATHVAGLNLF